MGNGIVEETLEAPCGNGRQAEWPPGGLFTSGWAALALATARDRTSEKVTKGVRGEWIGRRRDPGNE